MVYVLKMKLRDGSLVYKIGVTKRQYISVRLGEIVLGFFTQYGYIPYVEVKKQGKCVDEFGAEAELHRRFKLKRHRFELEFTGSTEFFRIDEYRELEREYGAVMLEHSKYKVGSNKQIAEIDSMLDELGLS